MVDVAAVEVIDVQSKRWTWRLNVPMKMFEISSVTQGLEVSFRQLPIVFKKKNEHASEIAPSSTVQKGQKKIGQILA
jgi:hypothetical protein